MTRTNRTIAAVVLAIATAGCSSRGTPSQQPAPATAAASRVGSSSDATLTTRGNQEQQFTRIEELIQARAPGVQVLKTQDGFALRIRGVSSPSGITDPLIVIDGAVSALPGTRALEGINPQDVVRIEVLKDAATTAFYGMRGGSGVILITTRQK
jgi:TonB-dependent SusC/RagA subfamily outer membrane receptor